MTRNRRAGLFALAVLACGVGLAPHGRAGISPDGRRRGRTPEELFALREPGLCHPRLLGRYAPAHLLFARRGAGGRPPGPRRRLSLRPGRAGPVLQRAAGAAGAPLRLAGRLRPRRIPGPPPGVRGGRPGHPENRVGQEMGRGPQEGRQGRLRSLRPDDGRIRRRPIRAFPARPWPSCIAPSGTARSRPPSATTSPACSPPSTASSGRNPSRATTSTGSSCSATAPTAPNRSGRSRSSTAPTPRTCGSTWPTTRRKPAAACSPSSTTPTSRAGRCSPPRPRAASPLTRNTRPCGPASSPSPKPASPRATARRRRSCRPRTRSPTSSAGTRPTSSAWSRPRRKCSPTTTSAPRSSWAWSTRRSSASTRSSSA